MKGDPISFVQATNIVLDITEKIADDDFMVEGDPPFSKILIDEKGKSPSSSCLRPSRAARSKTIRKR